MRRSQNALEAPQEVDRCADEELLAVEAPLEDVAHPGAELVVVDSLGVEEDLVEEAATVVAGLSVVVEGVGAVVTRLFTTDLAFWRKRFGRSVLLTDEHVRISTSRWQVYRR